MRFLLQRNLAQMVQNLFRMMYLGFLGAFPKAAFGWTTIVVAAAILLSLKDPNGWISN